MIRARPNTDAYRDGWERAFGGRPRPPKPERCPECKQTPCDPDIVHMLRVPDRKCAVCGGPHMHYIHFEPGHGVE